MAPVFPSIYGANYSTQKGKFFQRRGDIWIQIERYLPCATGTLNEPLEATAQRWLNELENGTLKTKRAIGSTGATKTAVYKLTEGGLKNNLPMKFAK
ncbi:hypothetical protein SGGMMB4_02768 [Sodalis glossinidius str. 'morsitans']|uniref:Uncharacterized protein n=1 Tax=Sodalis glossinidius (strain morsitans) TaxID=343509 RepID=A0A193QJ61_SODGM|nr:hypothetical protein [Sodalis glossinidius]CRL45206.1 hypothetical protein SGGMMB4_02768 [Sodalis glossinidius str. 'morsitans']